MRSNAAPKKRPRRVHLEIQGHRASCYGVIRSSYREEGKIKHSNHGRIIGLDLNELKLVQLAMRGLVTPKGSEHGFKTTDGREYGASYALLAVAKQIGLDKLIYSRPTEKWVQDSLAMIVGRVVYQGSKLSLSNEWENTALWELCGVPGPVNVVTHCYDTMDALLARQVSIEKKISAKHMSSGCMMLYDITSSYFEGEYAESDMIKFGYNRDKKEGRKQIVIGLICNEAGCPISVEVYDGNTQDAQTVAAKIAQVQETYGIKELIFVGDRGMVKSKGLCEKEGLSIISALSHPQIRALLQRDVIQLGLFDELNIVEIHDPEDPQKRYCLCKNPESAAKETQTREALLERTQAALEKIKTSPRKRSAEKIGERVGKVLQKYKMGKFITWAVVESTLTWTVDHHKIAQEIAMDGCYIIWTTVATKQLNKDEVVAAYKKLTQVELAFRNLKTIQLELRPVFHKTDDRIRAHVFICMLAYYLQWHLTQLLAPLFYANSTGIDRKWTFKSVLSSLSKIHTEKATLNGVTFDHISTPNKDQALILDLLKVKL